MAQDDNQWGTAEGKGFGGGIVLPRKRPLSRLGECAPGREGAEGGMKGEYRSRLYARIKEVLDYKLLSALFQPVVDLRSGEIYGYEGLVRGPSDSPLHIPANLYALAEVFGLQFELECLAWQVVLESFARFRLPGCLFLRAGYSGAHEPCDLKALVLANDLGVSRVVVELEASPLPMIEHFRVQGFSVGVTGLGASVDDPALWWELRPDFGRIDAHFVQGVHQDPVKQHYLRELAETAATAGCRTLAEGVETAAGLSLVKELGLDFAQGLFIARPNSSPAVVLPAEVAGILQAGGRHESGGLLSAPTAERLMADVAPVAPEQDLESVYEIFAADPLLVALPVVKDGLPIGLINRYTLIDRYARPFRRELYGKKPCTHLMEAAPLVVDKGISIEELSSLVAEAEQRYLSDGFIITDQGRYAGMGTGHALIREITQLRIRAARYANPLTGLPGNVPINEHIDSLLRDRQPFYACYCDLNHFKPFNDVYGYNRGDDVIQLTGRILEEETDPERDFVGHVGGDDFVVLFLSPDWERRCRNVLEKFGNQVTAFFSPEDIERGGYIAEDRRGQKIFHPLASLAIGAVRIDPAAFHSHRDVAAAAAEAKKQAKRTPGNNLFVERRSYPPKADEQPAL